MRFLISTGFLSEIEKIAVGPVVLRGPDGAGRNAIGAYMTPRLVNDTVLRQLPERFRARARTDGIMRLSPREHPEYKATRRHELVHYIQARNEAPAMRQLQARQLMDARAVARVGAGGAAVGIPARYANHHLPAELAALYHEQRPFIRGGPGVMSALTRPFRAAFAGFKALRTLNRDY